MVLVVGLGRPAVLRAENQLPFPRPASIEPNIKLWVDMFTFYSDRDFVVLDRDKVSRVYQVFHIPGDGSPTRDDIDWANAYLKNKYGDILQHLAAGHEPDSYEERRVAAMFKGEPLSAYSLAADNLRVQEGLRERFREGLVRSRYYRPTMERIFRQSGLPPELVTLAQVESGFQTRAKSTAGACGIWQFTRATGAKYMKVSRHHDDRLNPIRSTEAAAKLLRANYDTLGDWPLAITAYNYGTGGTARAAEVSGGDYSKMIERYSGPHFGFAVKNYYAEFLAALQVRGRGHVLSRNQGRCGQGRNQPQLYSPSRRHARRNRVDVRHFGKRADGRQRHRQSQRVAGRLYDRDSGFRLDFRR